MAGIPTWGGRKAQAALRLVKADGRRHHRPCILCGEPIDYDLEYPHPRSCSVQHIKSRYHYPELTWDRTNWSACHLQCNQQAGTGESLDLGETAW